MTTLNPSHNPFRSSSGRHAQAVHRPSPEPSDDGDRNPGPSTYPDEIPLDDLDSDDLDGERKARREGRKRVKSVVPAIPDLRFEQSYLLSIRPYLQPKPTSGGREKRGPVEDEKESRSLVQSADQDEVFHWGREVDVDWAMVTYLTVRDHFVSPLVQGALWGWGMLFLGETSAILRSSLYPASHVPRGRIVGGSGGSIAQAGGRSAVGETGWWRKWVKSWGGALETAVA